MKIRLILAFILLTNLVWAQDFEGTIKWSMKMNFTDPKMKAQMEEAEKKMKDPATQAQMKAAMEQMNNPQFKQMMELNPQMKAQMEMLKNMQNGGSMFPTGMTVRTKSGNALTKMDGGPLGNVETLSLKDKNESYLINRQAKTYSVVPHNTESTTTTGHEAAVKVTKTKETQKILNYTCTKTLVTITQGEHTINNVLWTTTELKGVDYKNLASHDKDAIYFKDVEGVPLKVEMTIPQGAMTMEVTEVKKETLPASDFEIPAGFTKTSLTGQ